ncbi:hypothetical protein [Pseudodesulfovibrio methanolicus]|uniref:Uncharacterized protein n=1 Tax=Pseudodesulfovibrio methanolicus TaxID=3126690 RepID=A0ABZ2J4H9_9BACT
MFDFGKSLISMDPDKQKKMLGNATPGQRKSALELGIGFNNQNQQQQQRQQKRDAYHDLDRLNTIVEKENEAHDFFGKGLADWRKNVTGSNPSKDATNLKKQFDDYEHSILSGVPKGGKRHEALSKSLPGIKDGFLKQGHQFAVDKLNERSRSVLDKGLQRIAQGALGARDEKGVKAHDDAAFDLINKYVLSEARFDEKDADAMYGKYLGYAGVEAAKNLEASAMEDSGDGDNPAQQKATAVMEKSEDRQAAPAKSSTEHARKMEAEAAKPGNSTQAAHLIGEWEKETGNSAKEVEEHYRQQPGAKPTWIKDELGKTAYYEKRAKDFEERNPGKTAPAYYREYGDKYVKRFDKLKPGLSKKGQEWMERTKDLLQVKMESGLRSGKWDESKPEELKEKAYDSHSEAYLEAGLADLPQEDIDKVIQAVDRMDMLDPKALKESLQVGGEFISQREFGKAGRSVLTGASHLVPSKEELGKAAKTVIESMPVLPPVR